MDTGGIKAVYPLLLHAYVQKINLAYRDGFQELFFYSASFLFSLYLLYKYGSCWKPDSFYSDNFVKAFPMVLGEVEVQLYESSEDTLKRCYIVRTLQGFAEFFGLADVGQISDSPVNREYRVRSTNLLQDIVSFKVI